MVNRNRLRLVMIQIISNGGGHGIDGGGHGIGGGGSSDINKWDVRLLERGKQMLIGISILSITDS